MTESAAAAVRTAVGRAGGNGLRLDRLEELVISVDPSVASSPDRRGKIAAIITDLEAEGTLRTPASARDWDHSGTPHLPLWVRPPLGSLGRPSARGGRLPASYRSELSAARSLEPLTPTELTILRDVNAWLVARSVGPSPLSVAHRERSLEVFGHEKSLDDLASSRLFATGVLSFQLLSCEWVPPQLAWRRVGPGPEALVLENAATFYSCLRLLTTNPQSIGIVAYGAGNAFAKTVAGFMDEEIGPLQTIHYFGDLDAAGIEIPLRASLEATRLGLPAPTPASGLYKLLLTYGHQEPTNQEPTERADRLGSWFADLGPQVSVLLTNGTRLAQEAVGLELLTNHQTALYG